VVERPLSEISEISHVHEVEDTSLLDPNQLLQNPLIGKIWNFGASAVDTGATLISKVGGKLQEKLDETGVTYRVANVVNTAASKTTQIGSKIYHKSAEKIS